ncbi:MAG: peptidoglycan editing factor PgeF [Chloroflexota bacterium]|nr:MAG: peptidoglycan editing factor PgeF [Chloroflexota bacterium]
MEYLQFDSLRAGGIRHAITDRSADLSSRAILDEPAAADRRDAAVRTVGLDPAGLVCAHQVHGAAVTRVRAADRGRGARDPASAIPATDALIADEPWITLAMYFADCLPLLFACPTRGVFALAHAGWRGTVANVAGATVAALGREFSVPADEIVVGLGPCIRACCYEIGEDVAAQLVRAAPSEPVAAIRSNRGFVGDIAAVNRAQLVAAGVSRDAISDSAICTSCSVDRFFSHRAGHGEAGRFAAIIGRND